MYEIDLFDESHVLVEHLKPLWYIIDRFHAVSQVRPSS